MISRALNSFSFRRDADERSVSHCGCAWQAAIVKGVCYLGRRDCSSTHTRDKKREELRSSERSDVFQQYFFFFPSTV